MKTEFIQTNDRLVSLKNVSNINILHRDNRIIFNMNYYIEIDKRGQYKLISDYVYWDLLTKEQLEHAIRVIQNNKYFKDNFLTHGSASVNFSEVSSIKFSDKKKRIILNLSHPITFTDYNGNDNITSEFVYWNYDDFNEYKSAEQELKTKLIGE